MTETNDMTSRNRHDPIPALTGEKGRQYYCQNSDGEWFYLNHADEWQLMAPPTETAKEIHRPPIEDESWEGPPEYETHPVKVKARGVWYVRADVTGTRRTNDEA